MAIDPALFKAANAALKAALQKQAFTPMGPQGATQPPPPPQGGGPGMDPSGGGGAPPPGMDPSQGGGPPPDPSMMGPEGAPQGGGGEAVTVQLQDLVQLFQMVAGGGGAPPPDAGGGAMPPAPGGAPMPAPGGAPVPGGDAGAAPKGKGGKGNDIAMLNDKIDKLTNAVNQMVAFFTGVQSATGGAEGGAAPGGQEDIGMSAPPSMGGGVDASQGPPTPMMPGMPPGAMPGTDGGGAMGGPPGGPPGGGGAPPPMQVQASDRSGGRDPRILNRILVNLRK